MTGFAPGATGRRDERRRHARGLEPGEKFDLHPGNGPEFVSASEIEGTLKQHPAVFDAAVVGIPDPVEFREALPRTSVGKIQKHSF